MCIWYIRRLGFAALVACLGFGWTSAAKAAKEGDSLVVGVGMFDVLDDDDDAVSFSGEYRWGWGYWILHPVVGVLATTDSSVFGYAGIHADIKLNDRFFILPSLKVGLYEDGNGKDLGNVVEFASTLEAGYRFRDASRLSIAFTHISNAGLGNVNPGTEILSLRYAFPISRWLGPSGP